MRGNRTVKVDTGSLDAFHCPNMAPLVVAGINIEVDYKAIHRPTKIEKVCRVLIQFDLFRFQFYSQ